jgi:hypothetical protein
MRGRMFVVLVWLGCFGCGRSSTEPPAYAESEPSTGSEPLTPSPSETIAAAQPVSAPSVRSEPLRAAAPNAVLAINGQPLTEPDLRELEVRLGTTPEPGPYWYDERSGLWGLYGHGASGVTTPGLRAAPLPSDASSGRTHLLVNGRELTATERATVLSLLDWPAAHPEQYAGRYVLDAAGEFYGPANRYLGNLQKAAEKKRAARAASANDCAWLRLGTAPDVLGRGVTINCD